MEKDDLEEAINYSLIIYLFVCFLVGLPLNVYTYWTLHKKLKSSRNRTNFLKLNLCISDLLVLTFLGLWRMIYEIVGFWYGGSILCKFFKFGQAMGLEMSSAIMVCIAYDRLLYLTQPFTTYSKALRRTKLLIAFCWVYAVVFSIPQLFAFVLFDLEGHKQSPQCAFWYYINVHHPSSYNSAMDEIMFALHNYSHMISCFWLPIVLMVVFYIGIVWKIWKRFHYPRPVEMSPLPSTVLTDLNNDQTRSGTGFPSLTQHSLRPLPVQIIEEEETTGCPELVESGVVNPSSLCINGGPILNRDYVAATANEDLAFSAVGGADSRSVPPPECSRSLQREDSEMECDSDSMPELVYSSVAEPTIVPNGEVIQLLPCLGDFREPTTNGAAQTGVGAGEDPLLVSSRHRTGESSGSRSRTRRSHPTRLSRSTNYSTNMSSSQAAVAGYKRDQLRRLPRKTTKTTLILINAYFICWLPVNFNLLWGYIDPTAWVSSHKVFRAVNMLIVFNSVLNPCIYGVSVTQIIRRVLAWRGARRLAQVWDYLKKQVQIAAPCWNVPRSQQAVNTDTQTTSAPNSQARVT